MKEDQIVKHLPEKIDPIDRTKISKEWLEQTIQGRIRPRISDLKIEPVTVDDKLNQVVYVVEIPKSNTAHQANDKRYYKRFNFNSVPMFDYENRDILNGPKDPVVELEFILEKKTYEVKKPAYEIGALNFGRFQEERKSEPEYETRYLLKIWATIIGRVMANYLNAHLEIPLKILVDKEDKAIGSKKYYFENTLRDIVDTQFLPSMTGSSAIHKYGPSRYDPILPSRSLLLETIELKKSALESDLYIDWIVYSDNAEPRTGRIKLGDIENR